MRRGRAKVDEEEPRVAAIGPQLGREGAAYVHDRCERRNDQRDGCHDLARLLALAPSRLHGQRVLADRDGDASWGRSPCHGAHRVDRSASSPGSPQAAIQFATGGCPRCARCPPRNVGDGLADSHATGGGGIEQRKRVRSPMHRLAVMREIVAHVTATSLTGTCTARPRITLIMPPTERSRSSPERLVRGRSADA